MPLPGGPSSKLGNRYERWWTVYQLVRIINRQAENIRIEDLTVDKAEFVITAGDRQELHQTKRSHSSGKWTLSTLGNSQYQLLQAIFEQLYRTPNTRFVFVSGSDAPELRELTERARNAQNPEEFETLFISAEVQRNALKKLKGFWNNTDTATAYKILRCIEVRTVDESVMRDLVRDSLSALFLTKRDNVCDVLHSFAEDSIHKLIDREHLISNLRSKGFTPRQLTRPSNASSLISEATNRYIESIRKKLIQESLIPRSSTKELLTRIKINATGGADCVLTGKAGGGKTACVIECVETLRRISHSAAVLAFRLDYINPASSTQKLGEDLHLEESPTFVLGTAAEATSSEAVLVIDQLDAVSTTSGRNSAFFDVVEELLREARGWRDRIKFHVVVVCRKFDWENDHRLRRLLIKEDAHVSVTDFSPDEVKSVLRNGGFKAESFAAKQLELLRFPQNLSLFLDTNYDPSSQPRFSSTKELFDHYWKEKRRAVNRRVTLSADHWNDVVQLLCDEMSTSRQLSVSKENLDQFPDDYLDQMASEGVLSFDGRRYGFGHESFFDYCFARAFVAKTETLAAFLAVSEQHLFRRAQVRQVLVYLRDADWQRYCTELRSLLQDKGIRYHIKVLAVALAVEMPNPENNEWAVLAPWLESEIEAIKSGHPNPDKFASLVWERFFGSQPWFQAADRKGLIADWLASENEHLVDKAVDYIRIHQNHSGDRVAELLEPFMGVGGNWPQRFNNVMQWATHGNSRRFFELFLRLIDDGTLDDARGAVAADSTFWNRLHGLGARLDWVPELTAHWLLRRLSIIRETRDSTGRPEWRNLLSHDSSGSDHISDSATQFPEEFVQHVLPVVLKITDEAVYEEMQTPPRLDAMWPILFSSQYVSTDERFREALVVAVGKLAEIKSDSIGEILAELRCRDTYMANFFLLQAYTTGAKHFADDAVSELCDKPWRFKCGYSDSPYWVAIQLIKEIAPRCSDDNRAKLEKAILNYAPDCELTAGGYQLRGRASYFLLSGIPVELRSRNTQNRYRELERKFGKTIKAASPPEKIEFYEVGPPIEKTSAEKMTDEQWLRAIKKYDLDRASYWETPGKGGALELARLLQEFVKEEPERFARLSLRFPSNTNPVYIEHTLYGLKEIGGYTELKLAVCRKAYSESRDDCGKAIADSLGSIQDKLPDDAVQILDWLATEHADPEEGLHYGGGFLIHGINSTRGHAAEAIGALIRRDSFYIDRFRSTVERLVNDKSISVRACVGSTLLAIANHDWEFAIEQFARLIKPEGSSDDDRLLTTQYVDRFIYYALADHFGKLRYVIERMLRSTVPETSEAGARLASLAVLHHHDQAEDLVQEALNGNPSQRLGVTTVAASNIDRENCRPWSELQLLRFFNDSDAKVRQEAATCFRNLGEQPLVSYETLINKFCVSAAYREDSFSVLYALEKSSHPLLGITYVACEKFLERFSGEAKTIATHRSADIHTVIKLILRTYHQHQQDEWASKCLNLIDRTCLEGIYNIRGNLDEYER